MAESRSALIVATYAYEDQGLTRLKAPERDAEALSEVLADPDIGGFEVRTVINQPSHVVNLEVAEFFANRKPDELLLLHFSCHGVKDDSGELYFASTDTRLDVLEASAVSSALVSRLMTKSRSTRVVLLLDCCYAGAFARGMATRGGPGLDLNERLGGRGRAVITASTALQFAFEGTDLAEGDVDREQPSVFTRALVAGLRSGEADRDLDGMVSLDELYDYMYDEVTAASPHQTPGKWVFGLEGDLYLARRGTPVTVPSALPQELLESVESAVPWHRAAVVAELEKLLKGSHPGRALAARHALERLADDDSRRVAMAAATALAGTLPGQRVSVENSSAPQAGPPAQRVSEENSAPVPPSPVVEPSPTVQPSPVVDPVGTPQPDAPGVASTVILPQVPVLAAPRAGPPAPPTGRRRPQVLAAGVAVGALALTAAGWWLLDGRSRGGGGTDTTPRLSETTALVSRFVDGRAELVAVDVTTGERIGSFPAVAGRLPSISPDRQWVIYLAGAEAISDSTSRRFEPRLMRADGSEDRRWLRGGDECPYASRPTWNPQNPDELAIACLDRGEEELGIWRVAADGRLGDPIVESPLVTGDPTWTGGGTIVFAESRGARGEATRLMEVPADGSAEAEPVEVDDSQPEMYDLNPDWSEAGLLFSRSSGPEKPGVGHVVGTGPVTAEGVKSPTWSPVGDSSVSLVGGGTSESLSLWTADGKEHPLDGVTGQLGAPAWGSR